MNEPKKQPKIKLELDDDQLEHVSGGMDALPADQLEDETIIVDIVDNVIMPQIVTDVDPANLRSI